MSRFQKIAVMSCLLALLAGCTEKTEFGDCIGAFDEKKPGLVYKLSAWNLFLGIAFFELIVPPIVVVSDELLCPVGVKQ